MGRILYYMAHDPVGNSEAVLTEYDAELIERAAEAGIVFVAVDDNGDRTIVSPDSVEEPVLDDKPITLVQPSYVDERMVAVVDVFDALASELASPNVALMSVEPSNASTFAAALEKLKELVARGDAE